MVVLWWFYGGANARTALDIYYHLCLINTTYVMLYYNVYYYHMFENSNRLNNINIMWTQMYIIKVG